MADLTLQKPQAGQQEVITGLSDGNIIFGFPSDAMSMEKVDESLVISFDDGSSLVLEDFYTAYSSENIPDFIVEGATLAGEDFFTAMGFVDLMPAAGPAAASVAARNAAYRNWTTMNLEDGLDRLGGLEIGFTNEDPFTDDIYGDDDFMNRDPEFDLALAITDVTVTEAGVWGDREDGNGLRDANDAYEGIPSIAGNVGAVDPNPGQWLRFSIAAGEDTTALESGLTTVETPYGTITIDQNGHFEYVLNNRGAQELSQDEEVTETFVVTVTDNLGGSAQTTVTVTIVGTNDKPELRVEGTNINGGEGGEWAVSELAEDAPDPHANTVLEGKFTIIDDDKDGEWAEGAANNAHDITIVGTDKDGNPVSDTGTFIEGDADGLVTVTSPYGTLTIYPDGSYTYELNNELGSAVDRLSLGDKVDDVFTVTVKDAHGSYHTQDVVIHITGADDGNPDHPGNPIVELGDKTFVLKESGHGTYLDGNTEKHYNDGIADTNDNNTAYEGRHSDGTSFVVSDIDANDTLTQTLSVLDNNSSVAAELGVLSSSTDPVTGVTTTVYELNEYSVLTMTATGRDADGNVTYEYTISLKEGAKLDALNEGDQLDYNYTIQVNTKSNSSGPDDPGITREQDVNLTIRGTNEKPELNIKLPDAADNAGKFTDGQILADADNDGKSDGVSFSMSEESLLKDDAASADGQGTTTVTGKFDITDGDADGEWTAGADNGNHSISINGIMKEGAEGDIFGDFTDENSQASTDGYIKMDTDYGTFTIFPDGSYKYELDHSKEKVQTMGQGEHYDENFTITVKDEHGATSEKQINIRIDGTNDKPVISDGGESSHLYLKEAGVGTTMNTTTGVESDLALDNTIYNSTSGQTVTKSVTFVDTDTTDQQSFTISGPFVGADSPASINLPTNGGAGVYTELQTEYGSLTVLAELVEGGYKLSYTYRVDDRYDNHDNKDYLESKVDHLNEGESHEEHFTITANDGSGTPNSSTNHEIDVTIRGTNEKPIMTLDKVYSGMGNWGNQYVPSATGSGQTALNYTLAGWNLYEDRTLIYGEQFDKNGNPIEARNNNSIITGTFTVTDHDDDGQWTAGANNIHHSFSIAGDPEGTVTSKTEVGVRGESVSFTSQYGTLTVNPDGTYTYELRQYNDDGSLNEAIQILGPGVTTSDKFTVTVLDEHGASHSVNININIQGANDGIGDNDPDTADSSSVHALVESGDGIVILDDDGKPQYIEDGNGTRADYTGNRVVEEGGKLYVVNSKGEKVLDEQGNPVEFDQGTPVLDADGNVIRYEGNNADYFDHGNVATGSFTVHDIDANQAQGITLEVNGQYLLGSATTVYNFSKGNPVTVQMEHGVLTITQVRDDANNIRYEYSYEMDEGASDQIPHGEKVEDSFEITVHDLNSSSATTPAGPNSSYTHEGKVEIIGTDDRPDNHWEGNYGKEDGVYNGNEKTDDTNVTEGQENYGQGEHWTKIEGQLNVNPETLERYENLDPDMYVDPETGERVVLEDLVDYDVILDGCTVIINGEEMSLKDARDPNGDALFIKSYEDGGNLVIETLYGKLTLNTDTGEYTFELTDGANALKAGQNVTISFETIVRDNPNLPQEILDRLGDKWQGSESNSNSLDINIVGTNDRPYVLDESGNRYHGDAEEGAHHAVGSEAVDTDKDGVFEGKINGLDDDYDSMLNYSLVRDNGNNTTSDVQVVEGKYGVLVIEFRTGEYKYYPNAAGKAALEALEPGQKLVDDAFNINIMDENGAHSTVNIPIILEGTTDGPRLSEEEVTIREPGVNNPGNAVLTGTLADKAAVVDSAEGVAAGAQDIDYAINYKGDSGVAGSYTLGNASYDHVIDTEYGKLYYNSDTGAYRFELTETEYIDSLGEGQTGPKLDFSVTVSDGRGVQGESDHLVINIEGSNDAPVITDNRNDLNDDVLDHTLTGRWGTDNPDTPHDDRTIAEGKIDAKDVDQGDELHYSVSGGQYGTLVVSPDGSYRYVLDAFNPALDGLPAEGADDIFTVSVTDEHGAKDTITVEIHVPQSAHDHTGDDEHDFRDMNEVTLVVEEDVKHTDTIAGKDFVDMESGESVYGNTGHFYIPTLDADGNWDGTGKTQSFTNEYGTFTVDPFTGNLTFVLDNDSPAVQNLGEDDTISIKVPVHNGGRVVINAEGKPVYMDDDDGVLSEQVVNIVIKGDNDAPTWTAETVSGDFVDQRVVNGILTGKVQATDIDRDHDQDGNVTGQDTVSYDFGLKNGQPILEKDVTDKDGNVVGTIVIDNLTGEYTYKDNETGDCLSIDEEVTVTVYTRDDSSESKSSSGNITLVGGNHAPVDFAVPEDGELVIYEDDFGPEGKAGNVTISGQLDKDSIVDRDDQADADYSFSLVEGDGDDGVGSMFSTGKYGSLLMDPDGSYTYILDSRNLTVQELAQGDKLPGGDSFWVRVADGNGGYDWKQITVDIVGTNDTPMLNVHSIASDGSDVADDVYNLVVGGDRGNVIKGDADAQDLDKDISDPQDPSFSIKVGDKTPTTVTDEDGNVFHEIETEYGVFRINTETGEYSFTITDNDAYKALSPTETKDLSFTIIVDDNSGAENATASRDINLTIKGENDAASFVEESLKLDIVDQVVNSTNTNPNNRTHSGTVAATDPDMGDTMEYWFVDSNGNETRTITGKYGSFSIDPNTGKYSYTMNHNHADINALGPDEFLKDEIIIRVKESGGESTDSTLTVNIEGNNDAPTLTVSKIDNQSGTLKITDVDNDADEISLRIQGPKGTVEVNLENGEEKSFAGNSGTLYLKDNGDGTYSYRYELNENASEGVRTGSSRSESFYVWGKDAHGLQSNGYATVSVSFVGTNDAPVIQVENNSADPLLIPAVIGESASYSGQIDATDAEGDALRFQGSGGTYLNGEQVIKGTYGTLYLNNETGEYRYELDTENSTVMRHDNDSGFLKDNFTVSVNDGLGGVNSTVTINIDSDHNVQIANGASTLTGEDVAGNEGDRLFGSTGADELYGGQGDDYLYAGGGNDDLYGGEGDDYLYAEAGDDFLDGGAGSDKLYGGSGTDVLVFDSEDALLDGGDGFDILVGLGQGDLADVKDMMQGSGDGPAVSGMEMIVAGGDASSMASLADFARYGLTMEDNKLDMQESMWSKVENSTNAPAGYVEFNYVSETEEITILVQQSILSNNS